MNSNIILGYGYKDLARMVRKNKILSSYARDYGCYQYWQSGKTKYNCIKNFCNTTQINAIQGQETVCKAIEAQIKIKVLNQKELFYQDMKEFDIYNI
ncbi:MAG: hypothetical protein RL208_610, partial [Pseudomonadota bacterium]